MKESPQMKIRVDTKCKTLTIDGKSYACAIGKNGFTPQADGREGDGKTPLGTYPIRYGYYRADRISAPQSGLEFHALREDDGWCDEPDDPAYNRPVRLPYPASAEQLYRDSHVYDIIIVLGHNDSPPAPGLGSAIFLHIARENYGPTQGCIAVSQTDMQSILPHLARGDEIEIY
mgnify:CR=1 FL=1